MISEFPGTLKDIALKIGNLCNSYTQDMYKLVHMGPIYFCLVSYFYFIDVCVCLLRINKQTMSLTVCCCLFIVCCFSRCLWGFSVRDFVFYCSTVSFLFW